MAYWIAPWLGVVLVDRWMRGGRPFRGILQDRTYVNWAGPIAMIVAMAVSISLFSDQTEFYGFIYRNHNGLGDLTFEVGFALAAVLYYGLVKVLKPTSSVIDLT
jgi:NCS1 family nucleobase:cation symporter-1